VVAPNGGSRLDNGRLTRLFCECFQATLFYCLTKEAGMRFRDQADLTRLDEHDTTHVHRIGFAVVRPSYCLGLLCCVRRSRRWPSRDMFPTGTKGLIRSGHRHRQDGGDGFATSKDRAAAARGASNQPGRQMFSSHSVTMTDQGLRTKTHNDEVSCSCRSEQFTLDSAGKLLYVANENDAM